MTMGCRGLGVQWEESLLGEESLEDGSEEREYGERGLASGETPKISPGINRERAPVDTDLGTLTTGLVFSAAICGRKEEV